MAETHTLRKQLDDIEYLRSLTTLHLRGLQRREQRSRDELNDYLTAIAVVLEERALAEQAVKPDGDFVPDGEFP